MKLYAESEGQLDAIKCAHCCQIYTHPMKDWHKQLDQIVLNDTTWSTPVGVLWCEGCHKLTQVHLMFSKGNTYLHTVGW